MAGKAILFTAFEPSGDSLAAAAVAAIRRREPDRPIYAMAGPRCAEAGAQLIETTTEHAVMLAGAASEAMAHRRRVRRLATWMRGQELSLVVPTDSPAANWSICALARREQPGATIVHLAAPQLWAWAPWRIRKMRRLSDHVLCLLPFEPDWFGQRGMPGTFIGHPVFNRPPHAPLDAPSTGRPRLALLPGSRRSELLKNWPTMRDTLAALPPHEAIIALRRDVDRDLLGMGDDLRVEAGRTDAVLAWADVVLVVSGTASLQVAAHRKPMVVLYNASWWTWQLVGRWLIQTRTFTLPNLVSEHLGQGRAVPELVPHFGAVEPVAAALRPLLADAAARDAQRARLDAICAAFEGVDFAERAADLLLERA